MVMIDCAEQRLIVNVNDLRQKFPKRALNLLVDGFEEVIACQRALKQMVQEINRDYADKHEYFFVGFEGRWVYIVILFHN